MARFRANKQLKLRTKFLRRFPRSQSIRVVAFSRRGSRGAAHSGAAARHLASRRSATAFLTSGIADTQSGVSESLADAKYSGS